MLCKIYFFFFVIGFIGSVLSIVRSLSDEGYVESRWPDHFGPFFFFSSFVGITLVQFNACRNLINISISLMVGLFLTYCSQVVFKAEQKGPAL